MNAAGSPATGPDAPPAGSALKTGARLATLGLFALALVGLWQASRLEPVELDRPRPGLFPMIVSVVFVALALIVLIWPGRAASTRRRRHRAHRSGHRQKTRRSFAIYVVSLLVLTAVRRSRGSRSPRSRCRC